MEKEGKTSGSNIDSPQNLRNYKPQDTKKQQQQQKHALYKKKTLHTETNTKEKDVVPKPNGQANKLSQISDSVNLTI